MRNRHLSMSLVVALHFAVVAVPECAESADYRIELTFDQRLTPAGQKQYSVRAAFQRDDVANKLIAPNGRVFDYQKQYAESLTFQQFQTLAFGEWNAQSASSSVGFRVPALGQDDSAFKVPLITSPAPGSEVPQVFAVNWEGESRGFAEALKRTNIASLSSFHPAECCSTTFTAKLLGEGKGLLELDVYTRTILPTPQIVSQFPSGTDKYTLNANVRAHTSLATYIIVPEPSMLLLVGVAGFSLLCIRRR